MSETTAPDVAEYSAWLTTVQAAAALGITARTVRRRCKAGTLTARLITTGKGEEWQIRADSITASADASDSIGRVRTPSSADGTDTQKSTKKDSADILTDGADASDRVRTGADADASDASEAMTGERLARVEGFQLGQFEQGIHRAIREAVQAATAPLLEQNRRMLERLESIEEQLKQSTLNAQKLEQARTENGGENLTKPNIETSHENATGSAQIIEPANHRGEAASDRQRRPQRKVSPLQRAIMRLVGVRINE